MHNSFSILKKGKWFIRRRFAKLEDIMGNRMIFGYQKVFIKLTLILIIGVFLAIRGSTAPLVHRGPFLYFLFIPNI